MIEKLILGTVQLGLNYGVNNTNGKPSKEAALKILDFAYQSGISKLDTADVYGDSSDIIGDFLRENKKKSFDIYSKFIVENDFSFVDSLNNSLSRLSIDNLAGYSFHRFDDMEKLQNISSCRTKDSGPLGVSIYNNDQFEKAIQCDAIELIQIPFNLLDNYNSKKKLLKKAKNNNKTIHVRSVFLQGLFFKDPNSFSDKLAPLKKPISKIQKVASDNNISLSALALQYPFSIKEIDGVLIGVESLEQLKSNIDSLNMNIDHSVFDELNFNITNNDLLNPANWN